MEKISKNITVHISAENAFRCFTNGLNNWWPVKYTWSENNLEQISIDPKPGGLCSETGPYGFRIDWGRVLDVEQNKRISFTWQISPGRVPEPDPDLASRVTLFFDEQSETETEIRLEHDLFEKHGKGALEYRNAMNSEHGWDYILKFYSRYCER